MSNPFVVDVSPGSSPLISDSLQQWAIACYRSRIFAQEDIIPTRPGLLYFVTQGFIRLESRLQPPASIESTPAIHPVTLSFIGADQPLDLCSDQQVSFQAIAHVDHTEVFWLYWQDLTRWPTLKIDVLQALRQQYQHQLLTQSILSQRKTLDRLWLYLTMLGRTYGEASASGLKLPFALTQNQLAALLGITPVTVHRLLKQLIQMGQIRSIGKDVWEIMVRHPPGDRLAFGAH
ncbi:MAG: Crp/Fnr family transcriptional regulator [Synechococcus sp.]|nr:Crp/Fnr family transcriptional regulator [Synechococcus sp.]